MIMLSWPSKGLGVTRGRGKERAEDKMTGKAKIEGLTNSWYGFAVFSAISSLFIGGFGIFSIVLAVLGLLFSWIITFFLGRALVGKSSLVRVFLVLFSGLFMVLSGLGTAKMAWG